MAIQQIVEAYLAMLPPGRIASLVIRFVGSPVVRLTPRPQPSNRSITTSRLKL